MKDLKFSALLDLYGKALTAKQYGFMEQYYHHDYSLFEIAENESVSRQAVHACILNAQKALLALEDKLGFYERQCAVRSIIASARSENEPKALRKALERIEELL